MRIEKKKDIFFLVLTVLMPPVLALLPEWFIDFLIIDRVISEFHQGVVSHGDRLFLLLSVWFVVMLIYIVIIYMISLAELPDDINQRVLERVVSELSAVNEHAPAAERLKEVAWSLADLLEQNLGLEEATIAIFKSIGDCLVYVDGWSSGRGLFLTDKKFIKGHGIAGKSWDKPGIGTHGKSIYLFKPIFLKKPIRWPLNSDVYLDHSEFCSKSNLYVYSNTYILKSEQMVDGKLTEIMEYLTLSVTAKTPGVVFLSDYRVARVFFHLLPLTNLIMRHARVVGRGA